MGGLPAAGRKADVTPMREFVITTENAADLPPEFIREHQIPLLSLYYTLNDRTYCDEQQPAEEFYADMRAGAMPKTQQVNPDQAYSKFKAILEQGKDILHIGFTSAVSGSYHSECIAAQELREEFPDREIVVVDTKVGTLCEGMVVDMALRMKQAGKTLGEIATWVKENVNHFCLYATVDDLKHLYRGGRVSRSTAFLGTAIGIKPILRLNEEGNLVPFAKVRGRRKALDSLVDYMAEKVGSFLKEHDTVYISHGDCLEDAKYVAQKVQERLGVAKSMISFIGPVIGAHAGPGALALSFFGEEK